MSTCFKLRLSGDFGEYDRQAIALTQRYATLAVNTLAQVMVDQTRPAPRQGRRGDDEVFLLETTWTLRPRKS